MRDIPLFTTENGVASLYLKKIPYTKEAFIQIRSALDCQALLKECADVCRIAGAELIFGTGHDALKKYPVFTTVIRFQAEKSSLSDTEAVALPVAMEQLQWWRQLYHQKMLPVATAAPLTVSETEELILQGKAYCVYRSCAVIGIGVADEGTIQAVASVLPGGGQDSVLALAKVLDGEQVALSVASTNDKAIRLYKSLGFREIKQEITWYQFFELLRKNT